MKVKPKRTKINLKKPMLLPLIGYLFFMLLILQFPHQANAQNKKDNSAQTAEATPPYGENPSLGRIMPLPAAQKVFCSKANGYQGIWSGQGPTGDEYAYKYSGGLGTYPAQHRSFAMYAEEVNKTFFVWGGSGTNSSPGKNAKKQRWDFGEGQLLHMISYFDHETGMVPKPTIIFDKWTSDPHDNPVMTIDEQGFIWVFSPSHGPWTTRSFIHRSKLPYNIDEFETIDMGWFAYPQPWAIGNAGFAFFYTQYEGAGRVPYFKKSTDGMRWENPQCLAKFGKGHYQVSTAGQGVLGTAFDYHPTEGGLEARTNLYYLQTRNHGKTWETISGEKVGLPVSDVANPALVKDFASEGLLCYIKDLVYDRNGWPVIHLVTSKGWKPGPDGGPHVWQVARWNGKQWLFTNVCTSDNNYDQGALDLSNDDCWRLMGTSGQGPQAYNTGGEVELWESYDQGANWVRAQTVTRNSVHNHSHVRYVINAHPDFAAFWADGHARQHSGSSIFFTNREGTGVWRLPLNTPDEFNLPERVH